LSDLSKVACNEASPFIEEAARTPREGRRIVIWSNWHRAHSAAAAEIGAEIADLKSLIAERSARASVLRAILEDLRHAGSGHDQTLLARFQVEDDRAAHGKHAVSAVRLAQETSIRQQNLLRWLQEACSRPQWLARQRAVGGGVSSAKPMRCSLVAGLTDVVPQSPG
jgi:hypothetical protein